MAGWYILLISGLGREKEVDLCEFEASLVYKVSSRIAKAIYYTEQPCILGMCEFCRPSHKALSRCVFKVEI